MISELLSADNPMKLHADISGIALVVRSNDPSPASPSSLRRPVLTTAFGSLLIVSSLPVIADVLAYISHQDRNTNILVSSSSVNHLFAEVCTILYLKTCAYSLSSVVYMSLGTVIRYESESPIH